MNAEQAIDAHREWKNRFFAAMGRQERMDASAIDSDQGCAFGKWLHEDAKASFGHLESYRQCVEAHAAFHVEAGKVARLVNAGQMHAATQMLGFDTPYAQASETLTMCVVAMFKECTHP